MAEPQFMNAKTIVIWDCKDGPVPNGVDLGLIVPNIIAALEEMKYKGPVETSAYGSRIAIPDKTAEDLFSTGISCIEVSTGKDGTFLRIINDVFSWINNNEAPANIMLISGDGDYSYLLHKYDGVQHSLIS